MKVLIPSYCPEGQNANYFVRTLRDALRLQNLDVTVSVDEFWNPTRKYDIIHFQWPGDLTGYNGRSWMLSALKGQIRRFKEDGVVFSMTRHNVGKYYDANSYNNSLYAEVEMSCDIVFHMGKSSMCSFPTRRIGSECMDVIVPHHIYPNLDRTMSQSEARRQLGWKEKDRIVLSFGDFRADEERAMVLVASRRLRKSGIRIVAPRLFPVAIRGLGKVAACREIKHRLHFLQFGLFLGRYSFVPDKQMVKLFIASDVVLIQRKFTLNSGNLPMGFYFGKVVVGPDTGNVGEILRATGNPVFDPNSDDSVASALITGIELASQNKGWENRCFADENWRPEQVAKRIVEAYATALSKKASV